VYAKDTDFRIEACKKPDLGPGLMQTSDSKDVFKVCFVVHVLAFFLHHRMPNARDVREANVVITSPLTELALFLCSQIFEQFHG
jgi:hypothetical protein